jgi:hypothetical protein
MLTVALVCLAAAGVAFLWAAVQRWRHLADRSQEQRPGWSIHVGMLLLTACLLIALSTPLPGRFTLPVLGSWAGVASLLFLSRFLTAPSISLLVLPVGATMLPVAMLGGLFGFETQAGSDHPITLVHVVVMSAYLAGMLVTGAASGLYLVASRQLKAATNRALRLPSLPGLYAVSYRGLVITAAFLLAGISVGGVAWGTGGWQVLLMPAPLLSIISMLTMSLVLGLLAAGLLSRRGLALCNLALTVIAMITTMTLVLWPHG